jgi:hypothetical protein
MLLKGLKIDHKILIVPQECDSCIKRICLIWKSDGFRKLRTPFFIIGMELATFEVKEKTICLRYP